MFDSVLVDGQLDPFRTRFSKDVGQNLEIGWATIFELKSQFALIDEILCRAVSSIYQPCIVYLHNIVSNEAN